MKLNAIGSAPLRVSFLSSRRWHYHTFARYVSTASKVRQRRGDFWSPKVQLASEDAVLDATALLTRAGFIRQAYAGVYQFLPLGLRVLEKLERLIDKHMRSVGASKVSLSNLSSQQLWEQSGRLSNGSELFRFEDGGKSKWLLAPTHEEEITALVQKMTSTPGDLPIRLYQVGRKYRDEKRPRGGLLRGKEFVMKDLYTFDPSLEAAHATYHQIRKAYTNFFTELGIPFLEARADSGNMGGKLSHEYHLPNATGEDTIITCSKCDFSRNEEFVPGVKSTFVQHCAKNNSSREEGALHSVSSNYFVTQDGNSLINVLIQPASSELADSRSRINTHVIKAIMDDKSNVNTGLEEAAAIDKFEKSLQQDSSQSSLYYIRDDAVNDALLQKQIMRDRERFAVPETNVFTVRSFPSESACTTDLKVTRAEPGDACPECKHGKLDVCQAIEVGHTFHLGTRYSSKFNFRVPAADSGSASTVQPFVEMGCHGIGVSRIIAASVACLANNNQIRWSRAIAPFDVVLCTSSANSDSLSAAHDVYDALVDMAQAERIDVLLDDRQAPMGYKIKDSAVIGYPVRVIFGKALEKGKVEVVCSALDVNEDVELATAPGFIRDLMARL